MVRLTGLHPVFVLEKRIGPMNQIDFKSVLKAAIIGSVINGIIAIVSGANALLPANLAFLVWVSLCCGAILVPVGTGLLYGRFAEGKETMGQAALGGGLAGVATGIIFGFINSLVIFAVGLYNEASFETIMSSSTSAILTACCSAFIFGALLGALGGVGWSLIQGES